MGGNTPSQQVQTTTTNQQQGPNPVIAPKLESLTQNAWDWFGQNSAPPEWLPQSERTNVANQQLWQRGTSGLGYGLDQGARTMAANTLRGDYLNPQSNPAYQGWLEASFRPQAEQFRDILAPGIDAKFSAAGRPGSGAHFDTEMRGYQDLARSQSDAAAKAALGMYQGERANQFAAANLLPSFQASDYQNIQALQQAGALQDAYQQAQQRYEATAVPDWYTQMAQRIQGIYPGGASSGTGTTTGTTQGGGDGGTGNIIGGATAGAGLLMKALPMAFPLTFSDERLKDVHARVGFTDDGLPLFLYNYKGSSEPRIGPMAQHVAKVKPEAVAQHPSGYLAVDYSQLMPPGGLL
jgi:hypothetical protein